MNTQDSRGRHMTVDQYLALELENSGRHEYLAGEVFPMISTNARHDAIARRLFSATASHLGRAPWQTFMSDTKVRVKTSTRDYFYYPDLVVILNHNWRLDDGERTKFIRSPTLIAEVISPSTENVDRREKAMMYREIPTLEEYMLVAEEESEVVIARRRQGWQPVAYNALEDVAEIHSIGLRLPLGHIYEDSPAFKSEMSKQ